MEISIGDLIPFIIESNMIEGIYRSPTDLEIIAHKKLLLTETLTVPAVEAFVAGVARAPLRTGVGMDVTVGNHTPPRGGPEIENMLRSVLAVANAGQTPFRVHQAYENLHPFMDGNGRSGRAIWLWQMMKQIQDQGVLSRKFLHTYYYQSLSAER